MKRILIVTSLLLASLCHLSCPSVAQNMEQNQAVGEVQGRNHVGGLVGGFAPGSYTLSNSYARGNVSGSQYVGGLVGSTGAAIENTYSTGGVSGGEHVGGLAGQASAQVSNSYWNTITSGLGISDGGMGRNTSEMTYPYASNTFTGWDFEFIWDADSPPEQNDGYPTLQETMVHKLSIAVYPPGTGTASGAGYYPSGMQVTALASPETGYQFTGWRKNGYLVETSITHEFALTENTQLTAVFSPQTTSVSEVSPLKNPEIILYPNPTNGTFSVLVDDYIEGTSMQIEVYGILGNLVLSREVPVQRSSMISLDDQQSGIYLVVVRSGRATVTRKLVLQ